MGEGWFFNFCIYYFFNLFNTLQIRWTSADNFPNHKNQKPVSMVWSSGLLSLNFSLYAVTEALNADWEKHGGVTPLPSATALYKATRQLECYYLNKDTFIKQLTMTAILVCNKTYHVPLPPRELCPGRGPSMHICHQTLGLFPKGLACFTGMICDDDTRCEQIMRLPIIDVSLPHRRPHFLEPYSANVYR